MTFQGNLPVKNVNTMIVKFKRNHSRKEQSILKLLTPINKFLKRTQKLLLKSKKQKKKDQIFMMESHSNLLTPPKKAIRVPWVNSLFICLTQCQLRSTSNQMKMLLMGLPGSRLLTSTDQDQLLQ